MSKAIFPVAKSKIFVVTFLILYRQIGSSVLLVSGSKNTCPTVIIYFIIKEVVKF